MRLSADLYRSYFENGYALVRGLLSAQDVSELLEEADRLYAYGRRFTTTTEADGVKWLIVAGNDGPAVLRGLQYGYRISPILDKVRTNQTISEVLEPLLGRDLDVVVNTLFWKAPGEPETVIAYHQDVSFRKPVEKFRNIASSFVQFGVAVDPHGPENGGMRVVAGSQHLGNLEIQRSTSVMTESPDAMDLAAYGLSKADEREIELEPGDAVFWHPFLLHGSPANRSSSLNRRFLISGYMRSEDCDVGDVTFRDGKPSPWNR